MSRFARLREIESLDPERDCQRIMHLSFGYEFPWDSTRALEVALYRTYCVPSISRLLDRAGDRAPRVRDVRVGLRERARARGPRAHELGARAFPDHQRRLPLRAVHVHLRAHPLVRSLLLAPDLQKREARLLPLLATGGPADGAPQYPRGLRGVRGMGGGLRAHAVHVHRDESSHRHGDTRSLRVVVSAPARAGRPLRHLRTPRRRDDRLVRIPKTAGVLARARRHGSAPARPDRALAPATDDTQLRHRPPQGYEIGELGPPRPVEAERRKREDDGPARSAGPMPAASAGTMPHGANELATPPGGASTTSDPG